MYHVLCRFIILFRLLSVIVTLYSEFKTVSEDWEDLACASDKWSADISDNTGIICSYDP
jgi:hypothetical protein